MKTLVEPRQTLSTLVELYAGNRCPHEIECACRTSDWCSKSNESKVDDGNNFPMLHLAGCSMGNDSCCCTVLSEIESLANDYINSSGVSELPIPLELVYKCDSRRPIELRSIPLKAYFGCAWFLGNEWVIHLNSNNRNNMNRFTAFHEGFHIICSTSGLSFSKAGDIYKPLSERLADYFAASILMPRHLVLERWPEVRDVGMMSGIFDVPEWVMEDWLIRLGLIDKRGLHTYR